MPTVCINKKLFLIVSLIFFAGCESTGHIEAVSDGQSVQFEYQQGFLDNDGLLSIIMPDGEKFSGKFVQKTSSTSGNDWEIGESSGDDSFILKDSTTKSSHTDALLIGDKGNTMRCQFQLSNTSIGIAGGGIGSCKTSTSSIVYATF